MRENTGGQPRSSSVVRVGLHNRRAPRTVVCRQESGRPLKSPLVPAGRVGSMTSSAEAGADIQFAVWQVTFATKSIGKAAQGAHIRATESATGEE